MKKALIIFGVLLIMAFIIIGCLYTYLFFTDKKDVEVKELEEAIFSIEDYPKVDGEIATQPLEQAFIEDFTKDENTIITHNTKHEAYMNLIEGKVDLILITNPSEEELKLAEQKNIQLEIRPVVNEAFVFYLNDKNSVNSLTLEQIQKIYTGEITNWKEVGGDDAEIQAFQREKNSNSQLGMESLVMKGLKLKPALKENISKDMCTITNLISDYDNKKYSIGYSYYYYATTIYSNINDKIEDKIKFIKINGIEPNIQTIKDGTYPIKTAYYIIINSDQKEDSNTRKLVNAMLSQRGQDIAEEVGYVRVK